MSVSQEILARLGIDRRRAASLPKEQILKLSKTVERTTYNEKVLIKLSQKLYNELSTPLDKAIKDETEKLTIIDLIRTISNLDILYELIKGEANTPIEDKILKYIGLEIELLKTTLEKRYELFKNSNAPKEK